VTSPEGSLGAFLRTRRSRLDAAECGLAAARRRTPGLRREEVAERAGISAKWYTFLEQGRGGAPSAAVLDRLSRALELTVAEREHLFDLAKPRPRAGEMADVPPTLQRLLDAMELLPAFVKSPTWDIVAWNKAASVVLTDYAALPPERRNLLRLLFGDPDARAAIADWEAHARFLVAALRLEAIRNGWAAAAEALADELCRTSPAFAALWAEHAVAELGAGIKRLDHPVQGRITLDYASFAVDGRPDLGLVIFTPASPPTPRGSGLWWKAPTKAVDPATDYRSKSSRLFLSSGGRNSLLARTRRSAMRVFVTGATGFIGSAVTAELQSAGHEVIGLARSEESAAQLARAGYGAHRGDLADPESLAAGARACDGVIHLAFGHDFSRYSEAGETDRRAVEAMAAALEGSGKPLVITSGTTIVAAGQTTTEDQAARSDSPSGVRAPSEHALKYAAERGVRGVAVRLPPSVHGNGDHGFVPMLIEFTRQKQVAAYLGEGANRWPSVHRLDAARLFRLALEKAQPGSRLHAAAEEGISMRAIAEMIGEGLGVPARGLPPEEAEAHFGWMAMFVGIDNPTSSEATRETVGWDPREVGLLADMREHYFADAVATPAF
jgi:nucleoside-diphosphate-sugar epimerase/transcriptional regulator with XRE-family HTH domain